MPGKTGHFLFVYILATLENFYLKSSIMVGDNSENFLPEVTKMHLTSSTIVGENFENYLCGMAKKDIKPSTMVRGKFDT